MRQIGRMIGLVAVGLLLAACAAPMGSTDEPSVPTPTFVPSPADPLALIGSWTITEAGEQQGAILRLAAGDLTLFRACGLMGHWRATTDGLFVAHIFGADCGSDAIDTPAWLRRASGFRQDGKTQLLLDDKGQTVARLLPGARPSPGPHLASEMATPPVADDEARRILAPAASVPANLRPAVRSDLIGRWVPADGGRWNAEQPFAEFATDGEWRGSDGCNGGSGRWTSGRAGALLATAGISTLIGCHGVPVPSWLGQTHRAGFDGDVLVLLDQTGKELGRLRRAS
jgi:hypothetical protein